MNCLLYFIENYFLPAARVLLIVSILLCVLVLILKPAHGREIEVPQPVKEAA